jgi:hypothetical protein
MKVYSCAAYSKLFLASVAMVSLAACESSGSYRVASIGSVPGDTGSSGAGGDGSGSGSGSGGTNNGGGSGGTGTGTGTGNGGGTGTGSGNGGGGTGTAQAGLVGKVLVTAGNTVIGAAGKQNALVTGVQNNVLTPVNATVTRILTKTGQTLVDVGSGQSLILNGTGGKLGDLLKIDLASAKVIGAPTGSPLLGVSVLSPTVATGRLAAVNVGNNGPLVQLGNGTAGGTGILSKVGTTVNGVLGGSTGGGGAATVPVTGLVSNVSATVNGALGTSVGAGGAQANGALGANGLLGLKTRQ